MRTASLGSAVLASVLVLWGGCLAAAATAATRYASPTGGTAEPCAVSEPCELAWAIEKAKSGDEVVVEASALPYSVGKEITAAVPLAIHGPASGPLPEIDDEIAGFGRMLGVSSESTVSRLRLVATKTQQVLLGASPTATLERLRLEGRAAKQTLVVVYGGGGVLRDSVLSSGAEEAIGVVGSWLGSASFLRNDTIELSGSGSIALHSEGQCLKFLEEPFCVIFDAPAFDVANTILRGGLLDLDATSQFGWAGRIEISHSNYRAAKAFESTPYEIKDNGGNQTGAEPSLTSDFHELAGSATIDAGIADSHVGTQDLDGNARILGAAPDIGAYEFVPPPAPPSGGGSATGASQPLAPPSPAFGNASAAGAAAAGAVVVQTIACAGQPGQTCRFAFGLTTVEHLRGSRLLGVTAAGRKRLRKLRVTVGSLSRTLLAGQVATVRVGLNATGRRLLGRLHRLPVTLTTSASAPTGGRVVLSARRLTLRAPTRRRR